MAMTAKHYSIVSKNIKRWYELMNVDYLMLHELVNMMAADLAANDDKFNKYKFMKECGL